MHAPLESRAPWPQPPLLAPAGAAAAASEVERVQSRFGRSNWVAYLFAAIAAVSFFVSDSIEDWTCAVVIEAAAFCPLLLWSRRVVLGLPLMPVFALACILYYALPFVAGHPALRIYTFEERIGAATTVAGVVAIMTLIWMRLARPTAPRLAEVRALVARKGAVGTLLFCLVAAIAFQSNAIVELNLISPEMAAYGVLRAVLLTLGLLAMFSLAYLTGSGVLTGVARIAFLALGSTFVFYHTMSLYLVSAAQVAVAGLFGYFLGNGRVPAKLTAALVVLVVIMQAGKSDVRFKYWEESPGSATPVELFADWIATGIDNLTSGRPAAGPEAVPLLHRTSLIHMLLLTQTEAPGNYPYLEGSSYWRIPLLAVPRILWPERPTVTTTMIELNQHYGLLTAEMAETTSIGWGMIAESYANFGLLGCIGFAIAMGTWLGLAQKWTGRMPVLSARGMAGLLVMASLVTMESSAAQYVTTIAQSLAGLWLLAFTTMSRREIIA